MTRTSVAVAVLVAALLALPTAAPAAAASEPPTASAAAAKTRAQKLRACNKKARKKTGAAKRRALATCKSRFGAKRPAAPVPAPTPLPVPPPVLPPAPVAPPTPAPGPVPAPATPAPAVAPPPGITLTRDDAAAQTALGGGLFLEKVLSSGSVTMEYGRIFFYNDGTFRAYRVDWNSVSGEICNGASKVEGAWSLKEGYTFPEQGGGVFAKLTTVVNGQQGEEGLLAANNDPGKVYVASAKAIFDVNQNMRDQC